MHSVDVNAYNYAHLYCGKCATSDKVRSELHAVCRSFPLALVSYSIQGITLCVCMYYKVERGGCNPRNPPLDPCLTKKHKLWMELGNTANMQEILNVYCKQANKRGLLQVNACCSNSWKLGFCVLPIRSVSP